MIIIDATDLIVGRMATHVAKQALLGETVAVVNSEKAVITGNKKDIYARYKNIRERGAPLVGPYFPRQSDRFVKRTIRGMLPYKQPKGRVAFDNIKCYKGVPAEFAGKKVETVKSAHISKVINAKYMTVAEVCGLLGGR